MAGRHERWAHLHVVGIDRELAAPFVPAARKLLGLVSEEAAFNKLFHHTRRQVLPDGTVITATKAGEIFSMEIDARESVKRPRRERQDRDDFVVWARNAANNAGLDAEFPQQIIVPAEDDADWGVFTYPRDPVLGRSDGSYKNAFRDGVKFAGNIDWTDGKVRVNWYGPSRRYWYDGWRKPDAQYGTYVFLNGVILLNTLDHGEAAQKYVLGAALVKNKLYVVQAGIADFDTDYAAMYPAPRNYSWVSPLYPDGDVALRLCRYTVLEDTDTVKNSLFYKVAEDSLEVLWSDSRRGYVNPWFFNPDATVAETFAMPDETRRILCTGGVPLEGDTRFEVLRPSSSSENMRLVIDEDVVTAEVNEVKLFAYGAPGFAGFPVEYDAESEIAADYDAEGNRLALVFKVSAKAFPAYENYLELRTLSVRSSADDPEYVPPEVNIMTDRQDAHSAPPGTLIFSQAALLTADVRHRTLGLLEYQFVSGASGAFVRDVSLYIDGAKVKTETIHSPTLFGFSPNGSSSIARGRGLNRAQGIFPNWSLIGTGRTEADPFVSPLVILCGVGIDVGATRSNPTFISTRYVSDQWVVNPLMVSPYVFPNDELVGAMVFPAVANQVIGAASTSIAMLAPGGAETTIRGISEFHDAAHPYFRTDSNGMRVVQAVGFDDDGNFLASLTAPLAVSRARTSGSAQFDDPDADFYRITVGVSFSSGPGMDALTGFAAAPGGLAYADPLPNVYDARYTPIWLLGAWPEIAPPETEE